MRAIGGKIMPGEFSIKHDLHCHTRLSSCCGDMALTARAAFEIAGKLGYDVMCLTDHMWDSDVPGASEWYAPQNIAHVLAARAEPGVEGVRCMVGCETEYVGGGRLGLAREHFDLFDFVVIPPNHMHMKGFVRPDGVVSEADMAELFTCRLEEISELDIPMEKVGIAHLTCNLLYAEGCVTDVIRLMDERRLARVFDEFARRGAGIELNAKAFGSMRSDPENTLKLYRMAKRSGCRFYCASDAHASASHGNIAELLPEVVAALELDADDMYRVPER